MTGAGSDADFHVWVPVDVRFSDFDDQGHVNNAVFLTYFEQGRMGYFDAVRQAARAARSSDGEQPGVPTSGRSAAVAGRLPDAPTHDDAAAVAGRPPEGIQPDAPTADGAVESGDDTTGAGSGWAARVAPAATNARLELPLVVSEAHIAYRQPIAAMVPIAVGVRTARLGRASLVLEYAVRASPEGALYATGSTTIVCVDLATGRPRGLPDWTLAAVRRVEAGAGNDRP